MAEPLKGAANNQTGPMAGRPGRPGPPRNRVVHSIETLQGDRCIDIFVRPDGSYGFEGYRRDPEVTSGWYRITDVGHLRYGDSRAARAAAAGMFPWVDQA